MRLFNRRAPTNEVGSVGEITASFLTDEHDGGPAYGGSYDVVVFDPNAGSAPAVTPMPMEVRRRGMSVRDYFIGQALSGLSANYISAHDEPDQCAKTAVALADAVMRLRKDAE